MQERIQKRIGGIPLFLLHLISSTFNLNKLTPILPFIYIFLIFFIWIYWLLFGLLISHPSFLLFIFIFYPIRPSYYPFFVAKTVNKKIVVVLVLKHAYFHLNSSMYDIQKRSLNEVEIDLKLRFFYSRKDTCTSYYPFFVAKTVNKKIIVVLVLKHAYFHLKSSMYDIQKRSLNEVEIDLKLRFFYSRKRHLYFFLDGYNS